MNAILYAARAAAPAPKAGRVAAALTPCPACDYPLIRDPCWRCATRAKRAAASAAQAAASGKQCACCGKPLAPTNKTGRCGTCRRRAAPVPAAAPVAAPVVAACPACGSTRRTRAGDCARCADRARSRAGHARPAAPRLAPAVTPAPPAAVVALPPVVPPPRACFLPRLPPPLDEVPRPGTRPIGVLDGVHCACCHVASPALTVGCCPPCWAAICAGTLPSELIRRFAPAHCTGALGCPHPPLAGAATCLRHFNAAQDAA